MFAAYFNHILSVTVFMGARYGVCVVMTNGNPADRHSANTSGFAASASGPMARIYRPAHPVMQGGLAVGAHWVVDFDPASQPEIEPLMGWTASEDPLQQIVMSFPDRDSAVTFARGRGWRYTVIEPKARTRRPKSYVTNFRARF